MNFWCIFSDSRLRLLFVGEIVLSKIRSHVIAERGERNESVNRSQFIEQTNPSISPSSWVMNMLTFSTVISSRSALEVDHSHPPQGSSIFPPFLENQATFFLDLENLIRIASYCYYSIYQCYLTVTSINTSYYSYRPVIQLPRSKSLIIPLHLPIISLVEKFVNSSPRNFNSILIKIRGL